MSVLTLLLYYIIVFRKLAYYKDEYHKVDQTQPVSVVIAAHDEDYNLKKNLPLILSQDYPDFEVIVVNHASTDETAQLLSDIQLKDNRLKIVHIEQDLNFFKGKKFPLSIGIKSAKNDILLLTDADCTPTSEHWITSMAANYTSKTEVVLGYGPYTHKKGFLNQMIRYDTFIIAMQYFSFALLGIPYMGVGRNLSYRKSLFIKNKGFISHYNIASGDDDLFIRQVANSTNTRIQISKESQMYSPPKHNFGSWFRQKQRHLSTGKAYALNFKILLGLFSISQLMLYLSIIVLLAGNTLLLVVIPALFIYLGTKFLIQKKAAERLGENQLLLFSLFGDIFYVILNTTLTIISIFRKQKSWK